MIEAVQSATEGKRDFVVQSLRNYDAGPDPANYNIDENTNGVNLIYSQMSRATVERVREQGPNMLLGVWYWTEESEENAQMYMRIFHTCGPIDFFYSDKPFQAMEARKSIEEQFANDRNFEE